MAPGANIGEKAAVFEAVHGSAPDIAGKGIANPLALLLAAVMMLRHVGRNDMADRIDSAIAKVITSGAVRTRDLGGTASTKDLTAALKQALV
jgi:isocitrate dehydrogenase (NAD+)